VILRLIAQLAVNVAALWTAAQLVTGITWDGTFVTLLAIAVVVGIVNWLIKPIIGLLTLPLTLLTLGLFALVLNALMLVLTDQFVSGYSVDGFWPALVGGIVISIVSTILNWFIP
jgi:putative membrane protein